MVVFEEEEGGKPETIQIELVDRDIICSFIRDQHLPTVRAWEYKNKQLLPAYDAPKPMAGLQCPTNKVITEVQFASYGDPVGVCGAFNFGNCSAPSTKEVVERVNSLFERTHKHYSHTKKVKKIHTLTFKFRSIVWERIDVKFHMTETY